MWCGVVQDIKSSFFFFFFAVIVVDDAVVVVSFSVHPHPV